MDSLVSYTYTNGTTTYVHIMWSKEGSRMGCTLGQIAFCVTAHLRVYAPLQKLHPNFFIKALTDDLLPHVAKPQNADYPAVYVQVIQFRKDYDRLGNPHGLFRHPPESLNCSSLRKHQILTPALALPSAAMGSLSQAHPLARTTTFRLSPQPRSSHATIKLTASQH